MIIHGKFRHPVWVQKAPWCRSESDKKKVTLEKNRSGFTLWKNDSTRWCVGWAPAELSCAFCCPEATCVCPGERQEHGWVGMSVAQPPSSNVCNLDPRGRLVGGATFNTWGKNPQSSFSFLRFLYSPHLFWLSSLLARGVRWTEKILSGPLLSWRSIVTVSDE